MKTPHFSKVAWFSTVALILSESAETPCEETTPKKMTWPVRKVHFLRFAYKLFFLKTTDL